MTVATPTVPTLHHLVERACRAPSVHNTQPWRWQVGPRGLTLLADRARQLMRADPEGRDLVLSCGAALHHLRVAAAAEGLRALVRRMPYGDEDNVLAAVEFMPEEPDDEAIGRGRADRPPADRPAAVLLLAGAGGDGSTRSWRGRGGAGRPRGAGHRRGEAPASRGRGDRAARAQQFDWTAVDETAAWTGRRTGDGIPPASLPRRWTSSSGPTRCRPLPERGSGRRPRGRRGDRLRREQVPGALHHRRRHRSQLRAGEALSAVLLAATAQGLGTVPLSQATEVHSTRRLLRDEILGGVTWPQVIVRVGWKPVSYEPVPATPRRPLAEVVVP